MSRVLIVDDDTDILEVLTTILTEHGFEVQAITTPEEIYKSILLFEPQVILLDVNLKTLNGIEVCKGVKNHFKTKHIPVILVSGDTLVRQRIKECNAESFIQKPYDFNKLTQILNSLCK